MNANTIFVKFATFLVLLEDHLFLYRYRHDRRLWSGSNGGVELDRTALAVVRNIFRGADKFLCTDAIGIVFCALLIGFEEFIHENTVTICITSEAVVSESSLHGFMNFFLFHDLVVVFAGGVRNRVLQILESVAIEAKEELVL